MSEFEILLYSQKYNLAIHYFELFQEILMKETFFLPDEHYDHKLFRCSLGIFYLLFKVYERNNLKGIFSLLFGLYFYIFTHENLFTHSNNLHQGLSEIPCMYIVMVVLHIFIKNCDCKK